MTYQTVISFHNTIQLKGDELKQAIANAKRQEDRIYLLMQGKSSRTPFEILDLYCEVLPIVPITSIRRALNTLVKQGRMITTDMKMERLGKPNFKYLAI